MARHTTHNSRESSPQLQGPVFMRLPSQAAIDNLCQPRLPAQFLRAGLKMDNQTCCKTQRRIRDLALRHIDFSIPYLKQPQSQIDFFKREVLLDVELPHLTWYEDAWAVDVFLRILYHRPRLMRNLQQLDSEFRIVRHEHVRPSNIHTDNHCQATQPEDAQHANHSHQMAFTVCSDNQAIQPEDAQVCSDNQATRPEDAQHDRPHQMTFTVCSDNQITQPEDPRVLSYSTGNYAPPNIHVIA
ncbi:hypothetical protein EDB19DRAFT_1905830 [Suillus lakei]|nr:hypothetical protein EDB19DRAFT_1905830 [Suillus lakei]